MKIGILTLPLHTNYGGVLQAYALQYSLHSMGHQAYIIDCRSNPKYANLVKYSAAWLLKAISFIAPPLKDKLAPIEHQMRADKVIIRQNTERFIQNNIPLRHYRNYQSISKKDFDVIVVGSDQIWRAEYFPKIRVAFLDFTRGWSIGRIAYAASFGVDHWKYSGEQTAECQELISHFDAVSLREKSGVELCAKELLCKASEVADPTLLLPKEVYVELVKGARLPKTDGELLVSFLDRDPDKLLTVGSLSKRYSAKPFSVNSRVEDRTAPIEERIQPPIEEWLQGFINAKYIITDSFHAMVFAIIFNKPFIVYGNKARGYTRFSSLLSRLGLESQFVTSFSELNLDRCFEIEWSSVNERVDQFRSESLKFLAKSLKS
ncbi:MAG: polysaccharide pyruvyl transferase family protein [Rikenellaceae bacterium]